MEYSILIQSNEIIGQNQNDVIFTSNNNASPPPFFFFLCILIYYLHINFHSAPMTPSGQNRPVVRSQWRVLAVAVPFSSRRWGGVETACLGMAVIATGDSHRPSASSDARFSCH